MPRYKVERDVSGWSEDDLWAAALRATICAHWYEEMRWLTSYLDVERQRLSCIWDARSEEDVRAHAWSSGLPVTDVRAVRTIAPAALSEGGAGRVAVGLPARA
jgi:hypothetical protein